MPLLKKILFLFVVPIFLYSCANKPSEKTKNTSDSAFEFDYSAPKAIGTDTIEVGIEEIDSIDSIGSILNEYKNEYIYGSDGEFEYNEYEDKNLHISNEYNGFFTDESKQDENLKLVKDNIDGIDYIVNKKLKINEFFYTQWRLYIFRDTRNTLDAEIPFYARAFEKSKSENLNKEFEGNEERKKAGNLVLNLIEDISKERLEIDFYATYLKYKDIVKIVISKSDYDKELKNRVKGLIVLHDLIYANEAPKALLVKIQELQNQRMYNYYHSEDFEKEYGISYDTMRQEAYQEWFYKDLKNTHYWISERRYGKINCFDDTQIFYDLSFWLRRYYEGNTETVYKTLQEIDKDFS